MRVYACWDGDHIGREVGRAVMSDDVAAVRRVDQAINAGNELWRSFALRCDGNVIEIGGDEGRIELGAEHLTDLPAIAQQYAGAVGATVSVGIGMKLSESARALLIAKLRGGNQIVLWDPAMEQELAAAAPKTESEKIADEYLGKAQPAAAQGAHAGFMGHGQAHRVAMQGDHEEGQVIRDMLAEQGPAASPEQTHAAEDFEEALHAEASKQQATDDQTAQQDDQGKEQLRAQLVQVLKVVKEKTPVILQLQQADPEAFQAIMSLVQGVVAMGRETLGEVQPDQQQPVQKSEDLEKSVARIRAGKPVEEFGDTTEYDYSHVLKPSHRKAGYQLTVEHYNFADPAARKSYGHETLKAHLTHNGIVVGHVDGYVKPSRSHWKGAAVEPHSRLAYEHQGKGLGKAMYEALYAHAFRSGIKQVEGGPHSADAANVHASLADKHGLHYQPEWSPEDVDEDGYSLADNDPARAEGEHGPYSYTLKNEVPEPDYDHLLIGPRRGVVFVRPQQDEYSGSPSTPEGDLDKSGGPIPGSPGHHHYNFPPGSRINDRVKVRHADGTETWIEARSGQVQAQEPDAPLFGAQSHPVPSRQPGGK